MDPAPTLSDPDDTRRDERRHLRVTLLREIACQGDSGTIRSDMGDISVGGMFIDSAKPVFPRGATITVHFFLSFAEPRITARAEVQYVQERIGIGVRFVDLSAEDLERIQRFVEGVASGKQVRGEPNLRKSSRVSITIPVTVKIVQKGGADIEEQTNIVTLSRHGACLLTSSTVEVGTKVLLATHNGLEFKGSIVWVGDAPAKSVGQVGIQCRGLAQAMGFQFP